MCIPGLGESRSRPQSGAPRTASSIGECFVMSETSSRSSSPRPATAPVMTDRRIYNRRTANQGGASDSSQMSSLMWQPLSPTKPVKELPSEDAEVAAEDETTPYFSSDSSTILIKGGQVVNSDGIAIVDVLVEDGKISAVGDDIGTPSNATVIDAANKFVIPGGIDMNTHLYRGVNKDIEVADDFESGTRAALAGGTTMVVDLVIPEKEASLTDTFDEWKKNAEEKACCDFAFTVAIPDMNDGAKEDMEKLIKEYGVNTFKMYMSYKDLMMMNNDDLMEAFKQVKEVGGIAMVHAENGDIIAENQKRLLDSGVTGPEGHPLAQPPEVEEEAVRRACTMAKQANVPLYICSLTSKDALDVVKEFRDKGLVVMAESSAASLAVDGSHYSNKCWSHAAAFVTSPPLRDDEGTREQLMTGLIESSIATVGSDHCPFDANTRAQGREDFTQIPNGVIGIEERMSVVYQKGVVESGMEMTRFVEVTSTAAAKLLNCYPRKGCIATGSDADLVIWNPDNSRTLGQKTQHHSAEVNIFEGIDVNGSPEFVLSGGRIVVAENQMNTETGSGQFVESCAWPAECYDSIREADSKEKLEGVKRQDVPADVVDGPTTANDSFGLTCPRGYRQQEVYNKQLGLYQRPLSAHGVRNQQDSSFSLAGPRGSNKEEQTFGTPRRAAVRVNGPPGGQNGSFW